MPIQAGCAREMRLRDGSLQAIVPAIALAVDYGRCASYTKKPLAHFALLHREVRRCNIHAEAEVRLPPRATGRRTIRGRRIALGTPDSIMCITTVVLLVLKRPVTRDIGRPDRSLPAAAV